MNYTQAVEQAAAALVRGEDANWELARLTCQHTYSMVDTRGQPTRTTMEQWCSDVRTQSGRRFSIRTGQLYKQLWEKHGAQDPADRPSWAEAYYQIPGGSGDYASQRAVIERKTIERIDTLATPEQKREVAAKLLSDPAVADAVIEQPAVRRAVYESLNRQEQRAEVKHNTIRASDPVGQRLDREAALIDLEKEMRKDAEKYRTLIAAIGSLPERSDGAIAPHLFLRQSFVALEDAVGSIRTLLETGKSDIDSFLADVLKGN